MNRQEEIAQLKRRIDALENEVEKWEPVGGDWFIDGCGRVSNEISSDNSRTFGAERPTEDKAIKASDKMRKFNRLLAYHDEFCPDYEFTNGIKNWYIHYNHNDKAYYASWVTTSLCASYVFFEKDVAVKLMEKLNSGEVVL